MDIRKNIIFVGGIHGVGKTTLCKKMAKELEIEHFSASELISMINSSSIIKQNKKVSDIDRNQNILVEAIQKFLDNDKEYLIDGHFCLIGEDNNIEHIPENVFKSLAIKNISIVVGCEREILKRLKNRDNQDYELEFTQRFQDSELKYGKEIARILDLQLQIIS